MNALTLFFSLVILSFTFNANHTDGTNDYSGRLNASLPVFSWIDHVTIKVEFPDGIQDKIVLLPPGRIGDIDVQCLYEGTMEGEPSADVVVSGCQNDPLVFITIHSNHLIGRTMFNVRNTATEELFNPYDKSEIQYETYDYENELNAYNSRKQRNKRNIFEDYIEEDYDEMASDGDIDPPSNLTLDIKLGFEESLKTHLGGEAAAQVYVVEVFTHGRLYMKHNSLGTSLNLNAVGTPIYVANKHWSAQRASLTEATTFKSNESIPIIFFCYDGDNDEKMGISRIRKACDPTEGAAIVKFRKNIQLAANTLNHEQGHLVGLQHDKKEDEKDGHKKDGPCHGKGFMSEMAPGGRPTQFTDCNRRRFKLWYNAYGTCLREERIPADLRTCPYPLPSKISPCQCMADSQYNVYLFCNTINENLLNSLASSFQCRKNIHRMEINMMGAALDCSFSLENIGSLELDYFHLYNVSKINVDIEANVFKGSSKTLQEIRIEKLSRMERGVGNTIRTGAFSSLAALKNIQLEEDFQTLKTKAFSDLPLIVNLKINGVKTIETKAFYDMPALEKLDLSNSPVETISTEAFFNLPLLTAIDFNVGTITTLQTKSFSGLLSLSILDLSGSNIQVLPIRSFSNLDNLSLANLTKNQIIQISSNTFNVVPKLAIIDLSHNSISSLPSQAFENLPSLTKMYLNNNKIVSIHNNAMNNLHKLDFIDLSKNEIQKIGNFLKNIKRKDLIVNLRETKIQFLVEEMFRPFVENIVNQKGEGYVDVGSVELECRCDVNWLLKQPHISGLTKFHNALCKDGHTLEQVDAKMLERLCPLEDCPGIIAAGVSLSANKRLIVTNGPSPNCETVCSRNGLKCDPKAIKSITLDSTCSILLTQFPGRTCGLCSPNDSTNTYCFPGTTGSNVYYHKSFASNGHNCQTKPEQRITSACPCLPGP